MNNLHILMKQALTKLFSQKRSEARENLVTSDNNGYHSTSLHSTTTEASEMYRLQYLQGDLANLVYKHFIYDYFC